MKNKTFIFYCLILIKPHDLTPWFGSQIFKLEQRKQVPQRQQKEMQKVRLGTYYTLRIKSICIFSFHLSKSYLTCPSREICLSISVILYGSVLLEYREQPALHPRNFYECILKKLLYVAYSKQCAPFHRRGLGAFQKPNILPQVFLLEPVGDQLQ